MFRRVKLKREYLMYVIGSLVFMSLAVITLFLIFKGFKGSEGLVIPGLFTLASGIKLVILLLLFYTFDGLRLLCVFKTFGTDVSFLLMIKLIFINVFASGVTPLATGGGFAQIYFLNKNKVPVGTATAATTIRTVIASIIIFASVPVILTLEKGLKAVIPIQHGIIYSLLLILMYALLFYGLIKQKNLLKKVVYSILRLLRRVHLLKSEKYEKVKASVDKEISHFAESLLRFWYGRKIYFFLSILSSVVYLFLLFVFPFFLLRLMKVKVHILTVISIQVLITFLIYFTPTPGGSGVAEGGFALIFAHFVTSAYIAPLTFYWRFFTMYLGMIIGFIVFYREVWKKDNGV